MAKSALAETYDWLRKVKSGVQQNISKTPIFKQPKQTLERAVYSAIPAVGAFNAIKQVTPQKINQTVQSGLNIAYPQRQAPSFIPKPLTIPYQVSQFGGQLAKGILSDISTRATVGNQTQKDFFGLMGRQRTPQQQQAFNQATNKMGEEIALGFMGRATNIRGREPLAENMVNELRQYRFNLLDKAKNAPTAKLRSQFAKAIANVEARIDDLYKQAGINNRGMYLYGGKLATGFPTNYKGTFSSMADKKVRFEIDDSGALIKDGIKTNTVGDLLDHPQLFKQYPGLKNIKVRFMQDSGATKGLYNPQTNTIELPANNIDKSTLLHEIQHAIQQREGFARGGSPEQFTRETVKQLQNMGEPPTQGSINLLSNEKYKRLSGEIEARDVQSRMNLTPEQRATTLPYKSQGIPLKDQIVRFDDGVSAKIDKKIEDAAIKSFGYTSNPRLGAFITSEGKLIDGSGRSQVGPENWRYMNDRVVDHREIAVAGIEQARDIPNGTGGGQALIEYMNRTGNIRMNISGDGSELNLDVSIMPNQQQLKTIQNISKGKTIVADISDSKGYTKASGDFKSFKDYLNFLKKNINENVMESRSGIDTRPFAEKIPQSSNPSAQGSLYDIAKDPDIGGLIKLAQKSKNYEDFASRLREQDTLTLRPETIGKLQDKGIDLKGFYKEATSRNPNVAQLPVNDVNKVGPLPGKLSQSVAPSTPKTQLTEPKIAPLKSPGVSQSGNQPPSSPPSIEDSVKKISSLLQVSKPLRNLQEGLYSAERAKRVAKIASMGKNIPGESGYHAQLGALKGELPKVTFEEIRSKVQQTDIDNLFNKVEQANITPFEKITAKGGLAKLLGAEGGSIPTKGELALLSEIFPPEFVDSILSKRTTFQKLVSFGESALNVPRSIMATADLSAPLRQGIFLVGRPKQWGPAFKDMFKYALNEKSYKGLMDDIQKRPTYLKMRENKLALTDIGNNLGKREEEFMTNLVEKIPVFGRLSRASSRAYSGFLNKLRADTFDDLLNKAKQQGVLTPEVERNIAKFVNSATGRGELGATLSKAQPILNATLFSPRLIASRVNLLNPVQYAKLDPFTRKEAIKSLLTFAGTGMTVLTLAKLGGAEVGADPRSADFGKIKVGNTRFDIWGGFQQYIRAAAQLITGQKISTTTGKLMTSGEGYKSQSRFDIALQFAETKESPIASFISTLLKGQTPIGGQLDVPKEIREMFIPLVWQSTVEAMKEHGIVGGAATAIPSMLGVGTQTYTTPEFDINKMYEVPTYTLLDQLEKMPKDQANKIAAQIKKERPDKFASLKRALTYNKLQLNPVERGLIDKGVHNGARAEAIAKELRRLKTPEEKNNYVKKLKEAKIITDQIMEQLRTLKKEGKL